MKRAAIILAAYAAVGVVTFGHSAATAYAAGRAEYVACRAADPDGYCSDLFEHEAPMGGFVAAFVWPLYWSWELWS